MTRFILIEPCNFIDFPIGGQLSFARQLMQAFGKELALVGYSHKGEPTGKWYKKTIDGVEYDYFGIRYIANTDTKPFLPLRIQNLVWFFIHIKKILKFSNSHWLIQAPEILLVATRYKSTGIAYMFPGVTNPLDIPRYKWGRIFASGFYNQFLKSLQKTELRLACADNEAINDLKRRADPHLSDLSIIQFPTRFDSSIFFPVSTQNARSKLNIPQDKIVIACCGRINEVKGWQLIFESFREFQSKHKESLLIYIGDGEDKLELIARCNQHNIQNKILITGFQPAHQVSLYLNSCDIAVVGSIREGWSVSMLETLACGKAIVSTAVSGASTLIKDGENGYIVNKRDPKLFSDKMTQALSLKNAQEICISISDQYTISTLKMDLLNIWKQLES